MRYFFPALLLLAACQTTAPVAEKSTATTDATAAPAAAPAAALRGTRWLLYALDNRPVTVATSQDIYLQLSPTDALVDGQAGCNRFRGPADITSPDRLRFGALLSTKMACADMAVETGFLSALTSTRTYRISGDTLLLYGQPATAALAELHRKR
jgi:heat shock protein HslJ